jgi:hypothetical protein
MLGQEVLGTRLIQGKIDVSSLQKGLYLLKIKDGRRIVTRPFSVR